MWVGTSTCIFWPCFFSLVMVRSGKVMRVLPVLGYGPYHVDERGQIIGAHVKHGTASCVVEEFGVLVPGLVSVPHHEGGCGDGLADPAVVDELAAGLVSAAQKGVGSSAQQQVVLKRQLQHPVFAMGVEGIAQPRALGAPGPKVITQRAALELDRGGLCAHLRDLDPGGGAAPR